MPQRAHDDDDHHRDERKDRADREVELARNHEDPDPQGDDPELRHGEQDDARIGAARELGRIEGETGRHDQEHDEGADLRSRQEGLGELLHRPGAAQSGAAERRPPRKGGGPFA